MTTFELPSYDGREFNGAKIAILRGSDVLTLLRDNLPHIPFPNLWDLPGGGREGLESPFETAARELLEELSVRLSLDKLIYHSEAPSTIIAGSTSHFFVARYETLSDAEIMLGDEGQKWAWMPTVEFIQRPDVIDSLRDRLSEALRHLSP